MPLTDLAIQKAKPADEPVKLSSGKGLFLLVNPAGSELDVPVIYGSHAPDEVAPLAGTSIQSRRAAIRLWRPRRSQGRHALPGHCRVNFLSGLPSTTATAYFPLLSS